MGLIEQIREKCEVHGELGHDPQDVCCCGKKKENITN